MITYTPIFVASPIRIDEVRMSLKPHDGSDMPAYETTCNLIWETETTLIVSMLNGDMPRQLHKELALDLEALGVISVFSKRIPGKILPRLFKPTNRLDGMFEMKIKDAVQYFTRRSQLGTL